MNKIIERVKESGVIPVVKLSTPDSAVPLARALRDGGINCAEITFRSDAAEESIRRISREMPDFFIGAGTVLSPEKADAALAAGASFSVSPGFNPQVVEHCIQKDYTIIPGVITPSEIELAMSYGLSYLKFFPAEAAGGLKMIKAMSAPYQAVRFMPTGGVNMNNLRDYMSCKAVFACGGTWIAPTDKIDSGKFDEIENAAREASELLKEIVK